MQDSDDYFTDDFVLDDNALAVLEEEEKKYIGTQDIRLSYVPPPPKRLKTATGWRHGPTTNRRAETIDDLDDLPEISVHGDGSYGLHARHAAAVSVRPTDTGAAIRMNGAQPQPMTSSRHPATRPASSPSSIGRAPPIGVLQRQSSRSTLSSDSSIPPAIHSQPSYGAQPAKSIPLRVESDAAIEVDALRRQMEELRKDNERIQSALQDAVNIRMAKEGEVSVLRKNIEKTAQEHSGHITKLKAAKEEADAKQVQMQKEIKEEMERLRTQYTFKQHELETSTRKPQWSVRSKRTNTEAPPTPIGVPAQIRGWNAHSDAQAGPSNYAHETPRRPRGTLTNESPKTLRNRRPPLPDSPKSSAKLPGFYNAFATSTPIRSTQTRNARAKILDTGDWKGKGRVSIFAKHSRFPSIGPPPPSPPSSPTRGRVVIDINMHSDDAPAYPSEGRNADYDHVDMNRGDVDMMDDNADEMMPEEFDEITAPNWREELHRMILTHAAPSSTDMTFQTLMKAPSGGSMSAQSIKTYSNACTGILEVLAATSYHMDWESALCIVAKSVTDMADLLNAANLIWPLTGLLSLLTSLSYSLPSFSSFLLSSSEEDPDGPPKMLVVLCDTIRKHLVPTSVTVKASDDSIKFLALSVMELVESLCWNIPEDLGEQLGLIPRSPQVLTILLDALQPPWLLCRSVRLLVILSSRSDLFRSLLTFPNLDPPAGGEIGKEFARIPHIERLCSILVDTSLQSAEYHSLKESILTFVTMLSLAHTDALTILLESLTLIPSLVLYLTHLTTPFREDDVELMASPSAITSSIRAISRTVVLLNYLVFSTKPTCNLRQKLHHAPHRQFNGITYMFIVTFGALSYADPPDWIGESDKNDLEHITDMARDLLDLVVEGPEGDSVYAAYQIETDEGSITDDEEMEARLLDAN